MQYYASEIILNVLLRNNVSLIVHCINKSKAAGDVCLSPGVNNQTPTRLLAFLPFGKRYFLTYNFKPEEEKRNRCGKARNLGWPI